MSKPKATEYEMHKGLVKWLSAKYPKVRFHSDLSGVRLNMGTIAKMKALNAWKGFPDLMIYEQRGGHCGLAIELKAEGKSPWKKDGDLRAGEHLRDQSAWLQHLNHNGWHACFCTGIDEAMAVIDEYLAAEWERAMGFPDEYTKIPNSKDSPRYQALGNSMHINVIRWIGERIQMVEKL